MQKHPTRLSVALHDAGEGGMIMTIMETADQRQIPHARQAARRELVQSVQEGMAAREAGRRYSTQIHRFALLVSVSQFNRVRACTVYVASLCHRSREKNYVVIFAC